MNTRKRNQSQNQNSGENTNVPEVQTGTNVVKAVESTESMNDIFELNQQPTFSKEIKRERLIDAWGAPNKK